MKPKDTFLTTLEILEINQMLKASRASAPSQDYTSRWFHTIISFLEKKGFEIVTNELRDAETRLLQSETLTKEYFKALKNAVNPPSGLCEEARALLLIAASPEDRVKAIDKVWGIR